MWLWSLMITRKYKLTRWSLLQLVIFIGDIFRYVIKIEFTLSIRISQWVHFCLGLGGNCFPEPHHLQWPSHSELRLHLGSARCPPLLLPLSPSASSSSSSPTSSPWPVRDGEESPACCLPPGCQGQSCHSHCTSVPCLPAPHCISGIAANHSIIGFRSLQYSTVNFWTCHCFSEKLFQMWQVYFLFWEWERT